MESPQFLIKDHLEQFEDLEIFRENLLNKGIYSKNYPEDNLLLIYTKYRPIIESYYMKKGLTKSNSFDLQNEQSIQSNFEDEMKKKEEAIPMTDLNKMKLECRSLIIDTLSKQIVSYSCNTPICNFDAMNYLLNVSNRNIEKYRCYEGTLLSLFFHNDKWYLSTRRNLNCTDSVCNEKSYFDLFLEVIESEGFNSFESFTDILNGSYCYYFILLHHYNKNIVDYTNKFGKEYKKICLAFIRKKSDLSEVKLDELSNDPNNEIVKLLDKDYRTSNIFKSEKIEGDYNWKDSNSFNTSDEMITCEDEGIIIKIKNDSNFSYFLKIQTHSYQFNKAIGAEKNIFKGFINLYQNNVLVDYLNNNQHLKNFKKIVNPLNTQESYDTVGIIDSVFKVCTSELLELFKILWDYKTGKQLDTEVYKILPKEYKMILYNLRGILFKKRHEAKKKQTLDNSLHIKDVYQYLKKNIDTDTFEQFLRVRKLMINWTKVEQENLNLKKFSKINQKCDKVHLKLLAIFSNKLFPNIMPDDIPDPQTIISKSSRDSLVDQNISE